MLSRVVVKTKTDAAKVLLNNGWTFEEVWDVLREGESDGPSNMPIVPPFIPIIYQKTDTDPYKPPYVTISRSDTTGV